MGTTLFQDTLIENDSTFSPRLNLSPNEIEVCALHFIDGRSQPLIAEWLGVTLQAIRKCVAIAQTKHPVLKTLRPKLKRPRIVHLSQIENQGDRDNGPFSADEL